MKPHNYDAAVSDMVAVAYLIEVNRNYDEAARLALLVMKYTIKATRVQAQKRMSLYFQSKAAISLLYWKTNPSDRVREIYEETCSLKLVTDL